jgi:competence ComEA-like helix-hairpin-helix protein
MSARMQHGVAGFISSRAVRRVNVIALLAAIAILCAAAKKHPPEHPVDLNTATLEQLEQLPDVGPGMANAIVEFREKSGPFRRVEDLLAIRGITKQRLDKIRPYVIVNLPAKYSES